MTIEFGSKSNQGSSSEPPISVPALVIRVDQGSIRDYLAYSDRLPLLIAITTDSDPASGSLLASLESLSQEFQGKILTLVIDAIASPELAQAFEAKEVPALFGMLGGQPAPLFVGNQPIEQIRQIISRVLQVAAENGLNATVLVSDQSAEPELSESHRAAFDAIDSGDYPAALGHYQRALAENPNDTLAEAGIAQVKLLIRLEGKQVSELISATETDSESVLARADALVATGSAAAGFEELLALFERTAKEQREPIRLRLVELFQVVGNESEDVMKARKKLSLLLF
jgi:putative thioredoxin